MSDNVEKNENTESNIARAHAGENDGGERKRVFGPKMTENHEAIAEMLRNSCFVTDIAAKYGVRRETMSQYIHANKDLEEAQKSGIDALTDKYEARLHELAFREQELVTTDDGTAVGRHDGKVMATNFNAVKFWLERRASDRGYGAKIETNEVGNGRVPIIIAGNITEEEIAEAEDLVNRANLEARE